MGRSYRRESWIDSRVEVRASPIDGRGLFARAPVGSSEALVVWGGTLMTEQEIGAGRARKHSVTAVGEGLYLAGLAGEPPGPDDFMNHSCNPNVWMADEVTLVARRDIVAGEELTADYATWEADEDWVARWECHCGTTPCRRRVAGADWRRGELQGRYGAHFSPFIGARIRRGAA